MNVYTKETGKLQKITSNFTVNFQAAFDAVEKGTKDKINEIRVRAKMPVSLTIDGENYMLSTDGKVKLTVNNPLILSESDIDNFIYKLCAGSVYSYSESMKDGFLTKFGFRVGLGGYVVNRNAKIEGISKITSLNIRIPRHIPGAAVNIMKHIENHGLSGGGILAVSPPGQGKTTFLRELAVNLSHGVICGGIDKRFRVTIVDERSEIFIEDMFSGCLIDLLDSCPKAKGIEIATRVLSPEIIVCDEIGSALEAEEILKSYSQGVLLIASCHGNDFESVANKPHIKSLIDNGVFEYAYCMKRSGDQIVGEIIKCKE